MKVTNLKIAHRLILGFGLVIALMVTANVLGLVQIRRIGQSIESMSNDVYPKAVMANSIKDSLNEITRSMRNVLFLSTAAEIGRELNSIEKEELSIAGKIRKFETAASTDEDKQLLRTIQDARARFTPALDSYVNLIKDGQIEQARDLALPELTPSQTKYFESLDKLIEYQGGLMTEAGQRA